MMDHRLPAGPTSPALAQSLAFHRDPLAVLRRTQAQDGPVFTLGWNSARQTGSVIGVALFGALIAGGNRLIGRLDVALAISVGLPLSVGLISLAVGSPRRPSRVALARSSQPRSRQGSIPGCARPPTRTHPGRQTLRWFLPTLRARPAA